MNFKVVLAVPLLGLLAYVLFVPTATCDEYQSFEIPKLTYFKNSTKTRHITIDTTYPLLIQAWTLEGYNEAWRFRDTLEISGKFTALEARTIPENTMYDHNDSIQVDNYTWKICHSNRLIEKETLELLAEPVAALALLSFIIFERRSPITKTMFCLLFVVFLLRYPKLTAHMPQMISKKLLY